LASQIPQDSSVAELQASIALSDNRPEDAIAALKRELSITENNLVRSRLAGAQAAAGHLADAESTLVPWITAHPEDAVTRLTLGDIYLTADRFADAEAQYGAILEKNPNNAIAENNLAWVMASTGRAESALQHAQHAASVAPQSPEVLDTLGVILLQTGKT